MIFVGSTARLDQAAIIGKFLVVHPTHALEQDTKANRSDGNFATIGDTGSMHTLTVELGAVRRTLVLDPWSPS